MKVLVAELEATAADSEGFPRAGLPEIALLGRSNVGKSSLLNRLAGRRKLARTSAEPGKTRLLHFFRIERERPRRRLLLVDLPGYGWARVSKLERRRWRALVEGYLEGRAALRGALVLHDLRRELTPDEHELLAWLAQREVPSLLVLTKADKLPPMRRALRVRELAGAAALPEQRILATSAEKGIGIEELWRAIDGLL